MPCWYDELRKVAWINSETNGSQPHLLPKTLQLVIQFAHNLRMGNALSDVQFGFRRAQVIPKFQSFPQPLEVRDIEDDG